MTPQHITLSITGMSCNGCQRTVSRALTQTAGVTEALVDLTAGTAQVAYDADTLTPQALIAVVEEAGYQAAAN